MRPPIASIVLAAVALLLSLAFVASTLRCGAMRTEAAAESEPQAPAVCESNVHPVSIALALGSLASLVSLFFGRPEVALVAGIVLGLVGIVFVFSAGLWSIPVGVSLAVAGVLQMRRARPASAST